MGKILNFTASLLSVPWTGFCSTLAIILFLIHFPWGCRIQRLWGRGFLKLFGVRVDVEGLENLPTNSGFVLAPNHQSQFDIMLMATLPRDFRWVSKAQVAKIPLLGGALRAMGSYLVKRDQSGRDLNVMKEVEDGLRSGNAVLIFPEGTRTRTGELLPFKKGAFKAAQNAGVPLIPIAIDGTAAIGTPGKLIPNRWGHEVSVRIGKPFPVPPGDIAPIMESFRRVLEALIREA